MLITFVDQKACRSHPSTVEINTQIPIHLRNSPYEEGCFSFLFISTMMTSSTYCWGKRCSKSWRLMSFLVVSTGLESFAGLFGSPSCLRKQNPLCPQDEWRMGEVVADSGIGRFLGAGLLSSSFPQLRSMQQSIHWHLRGSLHSRQHQRQVGGEPVVLLVLDQGRQHQRTNPDPLPLQL